MDAAVAIFSEPFDQHAAAVQWALARSHTPVVAAPDLSMLTRRTSIHASSEGLVWRAYQEGYQDIRIRSVWFRRPRPPVATGCLEEDKEFVTQQWALFQKNVFDLGDRLIDALWINQPHAALAAESKLLQLRQAQAVGLAFPETVVTNRAEDVDALIERWGSVVYKSFYPHTWHSASQHTYHSIGVVLLDRGSELPGASIAMCPGIFQRYIDKKMDIRVTVIGNRMYAVQISKREGGAFLDWRGVVRSDETVMKPCRLGQDLEQKLRQLMESLGIIFGCIDLVIDQDDNAFFLEVNQAGQFLFVEDKLNELPLLQSMAAMLIEGRSDYSLGACEAVGLGDYLKSEEYQKAGESIEAAGFVASLER